MLYLLEVSGSSNQIRVIRRSLSSLESRERQVGEVHGVKSFGLHVGAYAEERGIGLGIEQVDRYERASKAVHRCIVQQFLAVGIHHIEVLFRL